MTTPISWTAPLDPHEIKDYTHSFVAELTATSDSISTSLFTLPSDAIAAGLTVHSQSLAATGGLIFLKVAAINQADAIWDNNGTQFRIRHTITTTGGRTLERSIMLTVKQL